ncbi:amidohydrolase family protein [soil metagenome]
MATFNVLIRGGRVIDGTGNPWFYGDVGISDDRIAAVEPAGKIDPGRAGTVIDAAGHVVCPGFIDIQSHSIMPLLMDGRLISKAHQGVTTEVMGELWTPAPAGGRIEAPFSGRMLGNDAGHWADQAREWFRFRDWLEAMQGRGVSLNIGSFIGGGTVREYAKGWDMGDPTDEEIAVMQKVTREAMEDGAFGVAPALIYPPSSYSTTDELTAVAEAIAEYGGVYITHVRNESEQLLEGIGEAIGSGRRSGCIIEIYHLKASGQPAWPLMPKAIEMIDDARAEGLDVTADMYPYPASGTGLSVLVPDWAHEGGKLYDNLADDAIWARIREDMMNPPAGATAMARTQNRDGIMPVGFMQEENQQYIAKRLPEIAEMRGEEWADTVRYLLTSEGQRISTIYFMMSEDNLALQLKQPWIKISSDAGGLDPEGQTLPVHPRAYGTFTRVLGKYVREEGVLELEDAIRKMTSSVADRLSVRDRGVLRSGAYADVVVLDPETVADKATFEDPHQLSVGIREVWVNGTRVIDNGEHTGAMAGRIVDGPGRIS